MFRQVCCVLGLPIGFPDHTHNFPNGQTEWSSACLQHARLGEDSVQILTLPGEFALCSLKPKVSIQVIHVLPASCVLCSLVACWFRAFPSKEHARHEPIRRCCQNTFQHLIQRDDKSPRMAVALASLVRETEDTPCAFATSHLGAVFGRPKKML